VRSGGKPKEKGDGRWPKKETMPWNDSLKKN